MSLQCENKTLATSSPPAGNSKMQSVTVRGSVRGTGSAVIAAAAAGARTDTDSAGKCRAQTRGWREGEESLGVEVKGIDKCSAGKCRAQSSGGEE